MRDLTLAERHVVDALADTANLHGELPEVHPADRREFVQAIHVAQNIILARPAVEKDQA